MATVTEPIVLDSTGQKVAAALETIAAQKTAPECTVTKSGKVATITTKDSIHGTKTATVSDGEDGGAYLVQITDAADAGETVTLSDGTNTYTATLSATGEASITVTHPGTYTATVNGTAIGSVTIGTYSINNDRTVVFAFHYSENDSNPSSVTYPEGYDNSGFTDPFYMNLFTGVPHYGDWDPKGANADILKWFYPKSCMLKYNGTVDYYLDENDETKKADGTASDVANSSYAGNAMMEWGQSGKQIYWKIVPDQDGKGFTFVVANGDNDDPDMKPWNHYNCKGDVADHFYTPKYFGSDDGTRLRSISGGTNYVNHDASTELTKAKANNQTSDEIWNTEVYADWVFLAMMEVLISKSMNTQEKFGYGRCAFSDSSAIGQGTMNGRGMFWGSNDQTSGVKIFGMENTHGNLWRRIAGLINDNGTVKIKLTYGQQDGSTVDGYNLTGAGYISHGSISGTNGGYTSHMNISNRGISPNTISGSDSTYYTDGGWFNNSQVDYAFVGGDWNCGLLVGAFCCYLDGTVSYANASYGAALSCKPLAA